MTMGEAAGGLLLGVDGGGSKTVAVLAAADGTVLGQGAAGGSNYQQVGADAALAALDAAIVRAFAAAGLAPGLPAAVCLGLAGVGRLEDRERVLQWAGQRLAGVPLLLTNDGALVLAAGTPAGWGAAVVCGTGSIALATGHAGETARVGGWGPLLGDEGSGYAVGRAALRAVMNAYDGRAPQTALTEAILAHWGLPEPPALVRRAYREPLSTRDIAELALLVDRAADHDAVAAALLAEAGADLARAARAALAAVRLGVAAPCGLAGGLITNSAALRRAFLAAAQDQGLRLDPITLVPLPALGAIRLAQRVLKRGLE